MLHLTRHDAGQSSKSGTTLATPGPPPIFKPSTPSSSRKRKGSFAKGPTKKKIKQVKLKVIYCFT